MCVKNTCEFFTCVADSFECGSQTNLSQVRKVRTYLSHIEEFFTDVTNTCESFTSMKDSHEFFTSVIYKLRGLPTAWWPMVTDIEAGNLNAKFII